MEIITPTIKASKNGFRRNQIRDENNNESSQKNEDAIKIIILMGSLLFAKVKINMDNTGPNTKNVQPKNSATVIFINFL